MWSFHYRGKMITIEAWRSSIGRHHNTGVHGQKRLETSNSIASTAIIVGSAIRTTFVSAKLISILLLIGCVEPNPGPTHGDSQGIYLKYLPLKGLIKSENSFILNFFC